MDTGNPAQVKEQKISKKMIRDQELADLKELLSYAFGRRVIWRVLKWAGIYDINFFPDQDSLTIFKSGMRNIGLMLLAECLLADPNTYLLMQKEANDQDFKERDK